MPPIRTENPIWKFFHVDPSANTATCDVCKQKFSSKRSNNLLNHLKRFHVDQHNDLLNAKKSKKEVPLKKKRPAIYC